jgi:hypothetical protein
MIPMTNHSQAATRQALAQRLTAVQREEMEMALLVALDACHRGEGTDYGANVVSKHLMIGMCMGSLWKDRALYDLMARAVKAFSIACARQQPTVDLLPAEYGPVQAGLAAYLNRVLTNATWQQVLGADAMVSQKLAIDPLQYLK